MNIAIAQLKYLVSRTELILRGLFCLHALLFSPLSSAAFVEPISYSFYGHSYQFTDQSFYWQLYQLEEINLDLKVINQQPISFTKMTSNWLIDKRNEWSSMIGNTGSQLDLFFAGLMYALDVEERTPPPTVICIGPKPSCCSPL